MLWTDGANALSSKTRKLILCFSNKEIYLKGGQKSIVQPVVGIIPTTGCLVLFGFGREKRRL